MEESIDIVVEGE